MSITYGGVGLSEPTDEILAAWNRWRDVHAAEPVTPRGFDAPGIDHLPRPRPSDHLYREVRLNTLVWPTGASRWAQFQTLATAAQLAKILAAAGDDPTPLTLELGEPADVHRVVRPEMFLLPPRLILDGLGPSGAEPGPDALYLLTLVDDRWFWWQATSAEAPDTASWAGLLGGLLAAVGVGSPVIDSVPVGYSTPNPDRWEQLVHKPIPVLLDAAAESCGCRVARGLDGVVRVIHAAAARTREDDYWTLYRYRLEVGGRAPVAHFGPSLPERVTVVFPGESSVSSDVTLASSGVYPGVTGATGRVGVCHADLAADAAGGDRTASAEQAAADWYRWAVGRVDAVFGAVVPWVTGMEDRTEWEWLRPCEAYPEGRVLTRVVPWPVWDRNRYGGMPAVTTAAPEPDPEQPAAADACRGRLAELDPAAQCVSFVVTDGLGRCAGVAYRQFGATYNAGTGRWVGNGTITTAAGEATPEYWIDDTGRHRMQLLVDAAAYPGVEVGCVGDGLEFAFGRPVPGLDPLCDGVPNANCGPNTFRVRISCNACPPFEVSCPSPGFFCANLWHPPTPGVIDFGLTVHAPGETPYSRATRLYRYTPAMDAALPAGILDAYGAYLARGEVCWFGLTTGRDGRDVWVFLDALTCRWEAFDGTGYGGAGGHHNVTGDVSHNAYDDPSRPMSFESLNGGSFLNPPYGIRPPPPPPYYASDVLVAGRTGFFGWSGIFDVTYSEPAAPLAPEECVPPWLGGPPPSPPPPSPPPPPPPPPSCCDGAGESAEGHPPVEIIIPDGPNAGGTTATYSEGDGKWFWGGELSCAAGAWKLGKNFGGGFEEVTATAVTCSPFGLVFPPAFGATAPITVSLA